MRVLIISPHPDDEVLGCGGTIAKYVDRGDTVYLCMITTVYPPEWSEEYIQNKKIEITNSTEILGIAKTFFLDLQAVKLDIVPQKQINDLLQKIVNETKPDIVFIPWKGDLNRDHRIVFESSLVATRPLNTTIKKILAYETLSETEWGQSIEAFHPNVYEDISSYISKKLDAMRSYKSELKEYPHPRSLENIEILAKKRGSEVTIKFAEAFMLIREINV